MSKIAFRLRRIKWTMTAGRAMTAREKALIDEDALAVRRELIEMGIRRTFDPYKIDLRNVSAAERALTQQ